MPDEVELEECRNCGQTVLMMCRLNTGFCGEKCEEDHAEYIRRLEER